MTDEVLAVITGPETRRMTMTADIDDLHAALDDDPSDQVTRLVLADAYDDAGDEAMADGLRWIVRDGCAPRCVSASVYFDLDLGPGDRVWLCPPSPGMCRALGVLEDRPSVHPTRRHAEEALCRALAQEATR